MDRQNGVEKGVDKTSVDVLSDSVDKALHEFAILGAHRKMQCSVHTLPCRSYFIVQPFACLGHM